MFKAFSDLLSILSSAFSKIHEVFEVSELASEFIFVCVGKGVIDVKGWLKSITEGSSVQGSVPILL